MADTINRPYAAFDIDGTIIRWQLYHAIADELARSGCLGATEYQAVRNARRNWKTRTQANAFSVYEQTLINLIDVAISGISVADFQTACRNVIVEYKDQVYTFTRDLISQLKDEGYLLFAVSASQSEIVKLLAEYYGFDDYGGSEYEVKDGYFTGQKELLKSERKPQYVQLLIEKHQARTTDSIAVGDSESDIPMLAQAENPIAFNPSRKLFNHGRAAGWKIVVERKNVIYELHSGDGKYSLLG